MGGGAIDKDPESEAAVACERLVRKMLFTAEIRGERKCTAPRSAVQLPDRDFLGMRGVGESQRGRVAGG